MHKTYIKGKSMHHKKLKLMLFLSSTLLFISQSNSGFIDFDHIDRNPSKNLFSLGNVFIDDDYFNAHINDGIKLKAFGDVHFLGGEMTSRETRKAKRILERNKMEIGNSGMYISDRFIFRDYFVTSLYESHINKVFTFKNIFIMDIDPFIPNTGPATQVPAPAAGLFFITSLFTLWTIKRGRKH